jgi:hypothetical protein
MSRATAAGRSLVKDNPQVNLKKVNLKRVNRNPANRSRVRASRVKVSRAKANPVKVSRVKPRTAPSQALARFRPVSRAHHRMEESGIAAARAKYIRTTGWSKAIANRCAI